MSSPKRDSPAEFYEGFVMLFPSKGDRVGTGSVIPTKFQPPNVDDKPQSLFPPGISLRASPHVARFINRTNEAQLLIFTDGACLDNGGVNARAGCSFVFRPPKPENRIIDHVRFRLEEQGPTGEPHLQTSNRAELRAVIAALRFREWDGEGFTSIVIATDSEYVVEGITNWVRRWLRNGWKTSVGAVKNQDLWKCLLGEMEKWNERGVQVQFWRIPREWNSVADSRAKQGAEESVQIGFTDPKGLLV